MSPYEIKMELVEILKDAKVPANQRDAVASRILLLVVGELVENTARIVGAHGAHMVVPHIYQLRNQF